MPAWIRCHTLRWIGSMDRGGAVRVLDRASDANDQAGVIIRYPGLAVRPNAKHGIDHRLSGVECHGLHTWIRVCRCLAESVDGKVVIAFLHCLNADPGKQHGQRCTSFHLDKIVQ